MSGSLKITDEGLRTVHSTLEMATKHLDQVLRNNKNQDPDSLGAPRLTAKAGTFSDSWSYAVHQIGIHASDIDQFIRKVADTFTQLTSSCSTT